MGAVRQIIHLSQCAVLPGQLYTSNGITSVVTLVGADTNGTPVFNYASAEAAVGYDFMVDAAGTGGTGGTVTLTTVPLSSGTTAVTVNGAQNAGANSFVDNISTDANIVITNFSANDVIDFRGGAPENVHYSSVGSLDSTTLADLEISYSVGNGHTNEIVLHDAVSINAFIVDNASAQAALLAAGHNATNFVTFA